MTRSPSGSTRRSLCVCTQTHAVMVADSHTHAGAGAGAGTLSTDKSCGREPGCAVPMVMSASRRRTSVKLSGATSLHLEKATPSASRVAFTLSASGNDSNLLTHTQAH